MSLDIYLEYEIDTGGARPYTVELFDGNITHNVSNMWREAKVFTSLYNSDGLLAEDVREVVRLGLDDMKDNPDKYKAMNPKNGWGNYVGAVRFLERFYNACVAHPKATIKVWS